MTVPGNLGIERLTGKVCRAAALFNHRLERGEKGLVGAYTRDVCKSTSRAANTGDCRILLHETVSKSPFAQVSRYDAQRREADCSGSES